MALERRLRAGEACNREILELMEKEKATLAARRAQSGLSYQEIIAAFRSELGPRLAVPASPSTGWIIRQVSRARELGLTHEQLKVIAGKAGRLYRGPIELEYLLRAATRIGAGDSELSGGGGSAPVHSGRGDPDD